MIRLAACRPALLSPLLLLILPGCEDRKPVAQGSAMTVRHDTARTVAATQAAEKKPAEAPGQFHFISLRNKDKAIRDSSLAFLKRLTPGQKDIVLRLNRVDAASYLRLDTMVIPETIDTDRMTYSVFPAELSGLKDVRKMIFFAYYPQAFAAYEQGRLVRWGPTNMGKKSSPTPTGLFSCNWKAVETVSTVDDEWVLKWNFNVWNKGGVGFHQYQLPGYPASHSCMRLLEEDAKWVYSWADQWIVRDGLLAAQGTPVLIFGAYPFGKGKPWWKLVKDPQALNITADTMNAMVEAHLEKILARQRQRDSVLSHMPAPAQKESTAKTAVSRQPGAAL